MRRRLMNFLRCANCGGVHLELIVHLEVEERWATPQWFTGPDCTKKDVVDGSIFCNDCRWTYPVVNAVPRMYRTAWELYPDWRDRAKEELGRAKVQPTIEPYGVRKSRASFSEEWAQHKRNDVTWIWNIEERVAFFMKEVGLDPRRVGLRTILDAGCGNGELTNAMTSLEVESVGMDLSNSVETAERSRTSPLVHYVQGDLLELPLQRQAFGLIYSSGVLHHTPDARKAFDNLVECLKTGGRIYIWLYGTPRAEDLPAYTEGRNKDCWLKPYLVPLPTFLQKLILYPMAIRVWLRNRLKAPDRDITFARTMVGLFDALTPYYRSHHHFEEVKDWFEANRLVDVTLSGVREPGFGVYGSTE